MLLMQINLIEARCQEFKIYFYRGFFTLVEKLKFIMLVLDVPKAGEEGKSALTSSCSLESGEAPQVCLGWRLSGLNFLLLRVLHDLSPCLSGNVSDRQVGARKRLSMTRFSDFKLYCEKGSGLMFGIKRKPDKAGLEFFLYPIPLIGPAGFQGNIFKNLSQNIFKFLKPASALAKRQTEQTVTVWLPLC